MAEKFYLRPFGLGPMGMNIKDPAVHAMAKQLAARRGTSVTDAVRQALQADLARTPRSQQRRGAGSPCPGAAGVACFLSAIAATGFKEQ